MCRTERDPSSLAACFDADAGAGVDVGADAAIEADAETGVGADVGADAEAEVDADADTDVDAGADAPAVTFRIERRTVRIASPCNRKLNRRFVSRLARWSAT